MDESSIIDMLFEKSELNPWDDDCALIEGKFLITTDSMSENTHFRRKWSTPEDLAIKLFHSNLSDISSSGGAAEWCLVNLGIPENIKEESTNIFIKSLVKEASLFHCKIIGGDTFRSESLQLTLTMGGKIKKRHLARKGGKAGDTLYITGNPGLSFLGLKYLSKTIKSLPRELKNMALERHLRPRARMEWALKIAEEKKVHAGMDLSDGIFQDAEKLARASDVGLRIDMDKIPLIQGIEDYLSMEEIISGGEDYEIMFLGQAGLQFPFPVTAIGLADSDFTGVSYTQNGKIFDIKFTGFKHF